MVAPRALPEQARALAQLLEALPDPEKRPGCMVLAELLQVLPLVRCQGGDTFPVHGHVLVRSQPRVHGHTRGGGVGGWG